jgi:transcriptional regulator with XRE-family HTH domain
LRREEVAMVAGVSTDYYTRLEQRRGPRPSPDMLMALTRALRLSLAERDHIFRLAGHTPPRHDVRSDHVSRGLQRVLDRLETPAMVSNDLGEVLAQNSRAVALVGDEARFARGAPERPRWYRWFSDPAERGLACSRGPRAPVPHLRRRVPGQQPTGGKLGAGLVGQGEPVN